MIEDLVNQGAAFIMIHPDDAFGENGPDSILAGDWGFVRRILDGRCSLRMPDGGLLLCSRAYRDNEADAVLLAVKHAEAARGEMDDPPERSLGQTVITTARAIGHDIKCIDFPGWLGHRGYGGQIGFHRVLDSRKIRDRRGCKDKVPLLQALADSACGWRHHAAQRGARRNSSLATASSTKW